MSDNVRICYGCMNKVYGNNICSCGWEYNYTREEAENLLPPGTILNNGTYQIGRKLGQGGFGITYLGMQRNELGLKVAIKEYYPRKLVYRNSAYSYNILLKTAQDCKYRFEKGREGFIEEAKRLVGFNELSSIVSVLGYFEENNTAYIVMEYINGIDLYHYMQNIGRTLTLREVCKFIYPIMDDLHKVHQAGVVHRDISPDNIMLSKSGNVKLIDFGAAVSQETEEEIKVLKKNGFAPLEQYDASGSQLGPWTDVYALCATIYTLLSGKIIPDARDRKFFDKYQSLRSQSIMVPKRLDKILKKGLAVDYQKRYQSTKELAVSYQKVRERKFLSSWIIAAGSFCIGVFAIWTGWNKVYQNRVIPVIENVVAQGTIKEETEIKLQQVKSASSYAVYDDMVYIRYVFEDGTIMLARSPIGTNNFEQVEYVTDGDFGQFCVYKGYLYFLMQQDKCLYRADISQITQTPDEQQRIEVWKEQQKLQKISSQKINTDFNFYIIEDYIYAINKKQETTNKYEVLKMSLDGSQRYATNQELQLTNCLVNNGYLYFTTKEEEETILYRVRADGSYYEELGRYKGDIPAMVIGKTKLYYLFNALQDDMESYLGCIGFDGTDDKILAVKNNKELKYCYMTGIVDDNTIYYTCSIEGEEMENHLYCYSLLDNSNKQISSECGRYIATSDTIDYIIFASMDGKEIRQMNKDGSNPKIMKEEDGSIGIQEQVDITSLEIIQDHVYYLDGQNVAYKKIEKEEL